MQNFPIECLISTWRKYEVKALLGLCLLPTVFLTVAVVAVLWERLDGQNHGLRGLLRVCFIKGNSTRFEIQALFVALFFC